MTKVESIHGLDLYDAKVQRALFVAKLRKLTQLASESLDSYVEHGPRTADKLAFDSLALGCEAMRIAALVGEVRR